MEKYQKLFYRLIQAVGIMMGFILLVIAIIFGLRL